MNQNDFKFKQAREFEREGKFLHAIQLYHSLLNQEPVRRTASVRLINVYEKLNKIEAAVNIFRQYLADNPDDSSMLKYYSHFLIRYSYFTEALDVLSEVSSSNNPDINFYIGLANYNLHEYEIAKINFKEFIEKNNGSDLLPDASLFLAKCYLEMNNFDDALNSVKEAEKIITRSYEVYFVLAEIYFYKEMFLHAHESIQKAMRLNKNEIFLKEWYSKILYELGEYEKAEKVLAGILPDINPNSDNYNLLGKIMLQLERLDEAEKYFNKSLQINPEDKIALAGINRCSK